MVIKENQPETYEAIEELFREAPWLPSERDSHYWKASSSGKAHGRYETRMLEASDSLNEWLRWPGVKQVMRRTCRRVLLGTGEVEEEMTYAITSLSHEEASGERLGTSSYHCTPSYPFWHGLAQENAVALEPQRPAVYQE